MGREEGKEGGGGGGWGRERERERERERGGGGESLTNVISSMYPLSDRFSVPPL